METVTIKIIVGEEEFSQEVPKTLIDMGGIEIFAKKKGYSPQIQNGETGEMEDNPMTALDYSGSMIMRDIFSTIKRSKEKEAREMVAAQMEDLL